VTTATGLALAYDAGHSLQVGPAGYRCRAREAARMYSTGGAFATIRRFGRGKGSSLGAGGASFTRIAFRPLIRGDRGKRSRPIVSHNS
jgi:hypothetical protein